MLLSVIHYIKEKRLFKHVKYVKIVTIRTIKKNSCNNVNNHLVIRIYSFVNQNT